MKLKMMTFVILLSMLLSLAACGAEPTLTPEPTVAQEVEPEPSPTPKPTETLEPTPTPEPTSTPEPTATPEPTSTPEPGATFEEAPCPFALPAGQVAGETVECGYLVVPEDRADPESPTIRLAVAIFHPPGGATEPDPIIYLSGGPAGSALEFLYLVFDRFEPLLHANRDLIMFDQRGVGVSEPALDCPEVVELSRDLLDYNVDGVQVDEEQAHDLVLEAFVACGEDLGEIANLAAYQSAANAADVSDLRIALGYDEVNLWGASYGTRLALTVMRDHPQGLRSVVLDSAYPLDADLYLEAPANVDRALNVFFEGCAADEACNAAYPDLRTVLFDTVDRLDETPADMVVVDSFTGESYDTTLTGDDLLGVLFQLLYETDIIPSLPKLIYDASEGNYDLIALVFGSLLAQQEVTSHGMHFSVQCHDEFSFNSLEEFEAVLVDYPALSSLFEDATVGRMGFEICDAWDTDQAAAVENEPVYSDIPTLVMAGEYDPITPPAWGRQVAATLENSSFFEYPGMGHGTSVAHECPQEMILAFWDNPSEVPDDACIASLDLPHFIVPGEGAADIELEPYTSDTFGISGVIPAGWREVSPGVFSRGSSGLDVATLLVQAAAIDAESLLNVLVGQLGLEEAPEIVGEREANDITWTFYFLEFQGLSIDIGMAESGGLALIVLLQSEAGEHEALYEAVFVPVVDALVPVE